MPLDDQQLDDLLREIEVPSDLKAKLREIPDRSVDPGSSTMRSKSYSAMIGTIVAIAASVLLLLNFTNLPVAKVDVAQTDEELAATELAATELADIQNALDSMDKVLEAQELRRSGEGFFETTPIFDTNETLALALGLSWQSSIDLGANIETCLLYTSPSPRDS